MYHLINLGLLMKALPTNANTTRKTCYDVWFLSPALAYKMKSTNTVGRAR